MKKITVLVSFLVLLLAAGIAEEVVLNVTHNTTAGNIANEISAALTDAGLTADQVERLVVTGDKYFNGADCKALATIFTTTTLKVADLSGVPFFNDYIPGQSASPGSFENLKVEEIIIPSTITVIRERAFINCPNLKKIVLPAGLVEIWAYAFKTCPNLEDLGGELPSGVTTLGFQAFNGCKLLALNTLPASLMQARGISFSNISTIVNATLANQVFKDSKVTFNSIPNGITSLGEQSLSITSISSISFPAAFSSIGNSAFTDTPISTLFFNGNAPTLGTTPFGTTEASAIELCYPSGATGFDVAPWSDMKTCVSTALSHNNEPSVNLYSSIVTDYLRVSNVTQNTDAFIYNTNGKLVHAVKIQANQEEQIIAVDGLPNGLYFLRTNQATFRFIKR